MKTSDLQIAEECLLNPLWRIDNLYSIVDKQGKILGGHILASRAGDLLAPIILAMHAGLSAETVASTIMPYPTMIEGVRWAADQ